MKKYFKRKVPMITVILFLTVTCLSASFGENNLVAYAMTQSEYDNKVNNFINDSRWKNGVSWGYSKKPEIAWNGIGCCSYVNDFARYVYGADSQMSGTKYTGVSNIKTGDILYVYCDTYGGHWIAVLGRNGNSLYVAEGNAASKVRITTSEWTISGNGLYNGWSGCFYSLQYGYHYDEIVTQVIPTGVTLNKTSATLNAKGATVVLSATVSPGNATNKAVTWSSSNTAVATVNSNGVVTAVGNGTSIITVKTASGGKTATCKITVDIPALKDDGWYYVSTLPSSVQASSYDIQYQNIYEKYAVSSPGSGWGDTGIDKTTYTKNGSVYESAFPLATSNTVRLEGYYYYHVCGKSTGINANFTYTSAYMHYDQISNVNSVYEYASYKDVDDSRYTYYHLKWTSGSDAYCNSSSTCDSSAGAHGNRSYYWYKMYKYQNYTANTLNLYRKTSNWSATKDSSATTVKYRYRLRPTGVTLDKTNVTLSAKGQTVTLSATVSPSNVTNKRIIWKSSNTNVATVDENGKVTAVGNGTAIITGTTFAGGKTATCNVTVNIIPTGVTLNMTNVTLSMNGAGVTLITMVSPSDAVNKNVTWKSSNTNVATVDGNGKVTAVGKGTAIITVTTLSGGKTATCNVTVIDGKVVKLTMNKSSLTITKGKTADLEVTATPDSATDKSVKWTSSNTKVAKVSSSGKITALDYGIATITATAKDGSGKKATCKVTVPYTITYKLNSGTNHKANPDSYYNQKITLKNPTRKGYVFKGWYTDKKCKSKIMTIKKGTKKNFTLYAKWSKVTVKQMTLSTVKNVSGKKAKVTYAKQSGVTGYEISYSTSAEFTSGKTKKVQVTKTSYTLTKLTKNKTYYVRVRAYKKDSKGNKVYGSYSKVKKVKITK